MMERVKASRSYLRAHRAEIAVGLLLAALTAAVALMLPRPLAAELFAVLLALIASVYVGFGLRASRGGERNVEVATAAGFVVVALLGLWVSPYFWVAGLVGHGVWDLAHHPRGLRTEVPGWYPPYCAAYDWALGASVLVWIWAG